MLTLDPQITLIAAITTGIGYLMIQSGLSKSALELKRRRKVCPSCGRHLDNCGC